MSSHSLEIEIGRHKKPKLRIEQRLCSHCNMGEIEDEFHFLLNCPKYLPIRNVLLRKVSSLYDSFDSLTSVEKFTFMLNSKDPFVNNWLAKVLKYMFCLRD